MQRGLLLLLYTSAAGSENPAAVRLIFHFTLRVSPARRCAASGPQIFNKAQTEFQLFSSEAGTLSTCQEHQS